MAYKANEQPHNQGAARRFKPNPEHHMDHLNYIRTDSKQILESVDRFCSYYKLMNMLADEGRIQSSLDRGAFVRPQDILNDRAWALLGGERNSLSYAYGPEAGEDEIRALLAEVENRKWNTNYTADNILITCGAWAGVNLAIEEVFSLKRGACVTDKPLAVVGPTHFQLFHRTINIMGIDVMGFNFVKPRRSHVPREMKDFDELLSEDPRLIVITNPTNPDAVYYDSGLLRELLEVCEARGIYVLIDEIQDFLPTATAKGLDYDRWIQAPNVIRVDSYSKKRALADYRVGWVIASKELLGTRTSGMIGRLSGFMGNAPRAANSALAYLLRNELAILDGGTDALEASWQKLENKERNLLGALAEIPQILEVFPREACISRVIRVDYPFDDLDLAKSLMGAGTLIMPCGGYGYRPHDNVLRVTFAERDEKIKHSVAVLKELLTRSEQRSKPNQAA